VLARLLLLSQVALKIRIFPLCISKLLVERGSSLLCVCPVLPFQLYRHHVLLVFRLRVGEVLRQGSDALLRLLQVCLEPTTAGMRLVPVPLVTYSWEHRA
jgi:hypothetical protein